LIDSTPSPAQLRAISKLRPPAGDGRLQKEMPTLDMPQAKEDIYEAKAARKLYGTTLGTCLGCQLLIHVKHLME